MLQLLETIKGIHPGIYLGRELKKRKLAKGKFALQIGEYPQTFTSVTKGKRRMNPALSLKIEEALALPEGFLMILQVYHDLALEKKKLPGTPVNPNSRIRRALFWDVNFNRLDWNLDRNAIILRVLERGNAIEKDELRKIYGDQPVDRLIKTARHDEAL
jgi:antitoxin HigA-1